MIKKRALIRHKTSFESSIFSSLGACTFDKLKGCFFTSTRITALYIVIAPQIICCPTPLFTALNLYLYIMFIPAEKSREIQSADHVFRIFFHHPFLPNRYSVRQSFR